MTVTISTSLQNRQADSWGGDLDLGFIKLYTGAQPGANIAPTGTLLVTINLAADAYAAAVTGVASKLGTLSGTAVANGTAGYALQRNAGNTRWQYALVSLPGGGGDIELSSLGILIGDVITITSSSITQPAST